MILKETPQKKNLAVNTTCNDLAVNIKNKKMKEEKEITEEVLKIPADMLLEILHIIVKEGLKHEVIQVVQNRSLVVISAHYDKSVVRMQKVIYNIQNILLDYQHYRTWENEEFNWRA